MKDPNVINEIMPIRVMEAAKRISSHLHYTPIIKSNILDELLGHEIYFKAELFQKTGAFKVRGVLNTLLKLKEQGKLPQKISAYSSGNHAQAIAWCAKLLNIESKIFFPPFVSKIKEQAVLHMGSEVINCLTRQEAEDRAKQSESEGYYFIHPSDNDMVIEGAGTTALEALVDIGDVDAIFASCGGGGLLSGTYLAKEYMSPDSLLFGVEPKIANDASISYKQGSIFRFNSYPDTIADGIRTLGVTPRTFEYLKKIDGFFEIEEEDILYWTTWLMHLLKVTCEPSCGISMAAAYQWLKEQKTPKKVLILLSGGNIDQSLYQKIWSKNYLEKLPRF